MISKEVSFIRKAGVMAVLASMAAFASCSRLEEGMLTAPTLMPLVTLDKEVYRPGEMAVCELELVNYLEEIVFVPEPYSTRFSRESNLNFRTIRKDDLKTLRRTPIAIKKQRFPLMVQIDGMGTYKKKFAFVNLTEEAGSYQFLAEYFTASVDSQSERKTLSARLEFKVEGERLWRRNRQGHIVKDDAIRIAREKYGRPVKSADAFLKETVSDLLDWWVTLERAPEDVGPGESDRVAYYISPYGGFVRREVAPFTRDARDLLEVGMTTGRIPASPRPALPAPSPNNTVRATQSNGSK